MVQTQTVSVLSNEVYTAKMLYDSSITDNIFVHSRNLLLMWIAAITHF